jgi:peroxiredoxin
MIEAGDEIPMVSVQRAPGDEVTLAELAGEGPVLLFFYFFDWSKVIIERGV